MSEAERSSDRRAPTKKRTPVRWPAPGTADIVVKGLRQLDSLTPTEAFQFSTHVSIMMIGFQSTFYQYEAGLIPELAARAAAAFDVKIFAIAIGRDDGGAPGRETVLTQAARITGGRYFHAADVEALETIYVEIDRLTLPSEELVERTESEPLARWPLLLALALIAAVTSLRGSRWGVLP